VPRDASLNLSDSTIGRCQGLFLLCVADSILVDLAMNGDSMVPGW
jgi:hypothetical protein